MGLRLFRTESSKVEFGGERKRMHAILGHLVVFLELYFVLLTCLKSVFGHRD